MSFAEKANAFVPWTQGLRDQLDAPGELEQQIANATAVKEQVDAGKVQLQALADLDHQLKERSLLENKHTQYTMGEVELLYQELAAAASSKVVLVQNQLIRRREKDRLKAEADALAQANDALKRTFATAINDFSGTPSRPGGKRARLAHHGGAVTAGGGGIVRYAGLCDGSGGGCAAAGGHQRRR